MAKLYKKSEGTETETIQGMCIMMMGCCPCFPMADGGR